MITIGELQVNLFLCGFRYRTCMPIKRLITYRLVLTVLYYHLKQLIQGAYVSCKRHIWFNRTGEHMCPVSDILGSIEPTGEHMCPVSNIFGSIEPTGEHMCPVSDILGSIEPTGEHRCPVSDILGSIEPNCVNFQVHA